MKTWVKKSLSCFLAVLMALSCCAVAVPNNWVSATDGSTVESDSAQPQLQEEGSEPEPPSTDSISEISTLSEEPVSVYAASDLIYKEGITRAEWLHDLAVIFEMTVAEDNYPDDYYADVTSDHPYYRDIMLTVEFGVINLPAGENLRPDEPADREFAASTLNYCLGFQLEDGAEYTYSDLAEVEEANLDDVQIALNRGWFALNGGAFVPTAAITNAELQGMVTDAQQILAAEQIDENYQSSYTYQPGVIEVPQETEVLIEDNTITIFGGNVSIQAGDVFVVYFNGLPQIYTAVSVVNMAGTLTITAQAQDTDEFLVNADAQGLVKAELGQFVPAEGVEVNYEYDEMEEASARDIESIPIKSLHLSTDLNLGSGITTKLYCDLTNMNLEYEISSENVYVAMTGEMAANLNFSADYVEAAGFKNDITLGYIPIGIIGQISVVANVDFNGSVTFTAVNTFKAGFSYASADGFRTVMNFQKQAFTVCAQMQANIGLTASAGLTKLPCVSGTIYASTGVRGGYDYQTYDDGNHPNDCGTFYAYLYANVGVTAGIDILFIDKDFQKDIAVWDINNSPVKVVYHYEEGVLVPDCTRNPGQYFTWGGSNYGLPYGSNIGYGKDKEPFTIYEYYELDEAGCITITGYNGNVAAISIPNTLDGHPVIGIGTRAFYYHTELRSVIMPTNITNIGDFAFANCTNLSNVILPYNLKKLGYKAFGDCALLNEITIFPQLEECGDYPQIFGGGPVYGPFVGSGISKANFAEGCQNVPAHLFEDASMLKDVIFPDTLLSIGEYSFNGTALKSIVVPDSVISIGSYAFTGTVETVVLGKNVQSIGDYAFSDCEISSLILPSSVNSLGIGAFAGCPITEITIPKNVNGPYNNFWSSFEKARFPGPFRNTMLQTVHFEEGTSSISYSLFEGCGNLTEIHIPETVKRIEAFAFSGSGLENVDIPENVTYIGEHAFSVCANLRSIDIKGEVTSLSKNCFYKCTDLIDIGLPDSLKTIETSAFESSGIRSLVIPDSVTEIGNYAFRNCTALESIDLSPNLSNIGSEAFRGCVSLQNVIIPATIETLGTYCFADCTNLSSVAFEDGLLTTIPTGAFYQCPALTEIRLPYSVTSIGNSAFSNCTGLTGITIPRRVESISTSAFSYPDRMTIYGVEGTYAQTFAEENGYTFVAKDVPAQSIEMASEMTVSVGGSNTLLTRTVIPEDYTDEVIWRSSDTSIATVTDTGLVTGRAPGTVTIRVNIGDASASCRVTVVQPVTSISITSSISLEALETRQISCTVRPNNANNRGVTWTSSDETVATVDENGVVTGLKKGTATITATAQDGSGISDTCTVTVTNTVYQAQTVAELESAHNYDNNCSDVWVYTLTGATSLSVTFDSRTEMEEDFDYLLVYDGEGNQIGRYTGTELAGATITVPGDTLRIQMDTDEGGTAWGFKVLSVVGDGATTEPVLTGISVNTLPYKTVYTVGEAFDPAGLTLTANYSDGSNQTISQGYTFSTPDLSTAGEKIITVSYLGQEASFTIQVKEETTSPVDQDLNQDGIVDVSDVMVLAQCIVNSSTLPSINPDMNQDGIVDVLDVMTLAQYIVNN